MQIEVIRTYHIDLNVWKELIEKEISIGAVVSELIKVNGIQNINSLLSILLDLDFLSSLISFYKSSKSIDVTNVEEYWSNN